MATYQSVSVAEDLPLDRIQPRYHAHSQSSTSTTRNDHHLVPHSAHTSSNSNLVPKGSAPPPLERGSWYSYVFREWKWELLTWAIGTATAACIVILFFVFDNRPLSHWHSRVSIAAIVAALAQVAQSSLMAPVASCIGQIKWQWFRKVRSTYDLEIYDEASRGPAGSLWLLVSCRP